MTERKKIKYGILLALLLITLYQDINIGDFCEGMAEGLLFAFLIILFFVFLIIIELRDLYKLIIKKEKFDFIPLLFLAVFILSNWLLYVANENRFWKKVKYEGEIDNIDSRAWIMLYENKTFEATKSYIEQRCTYSGKYHLEKNTLILDDVNIEAKTDNNFTRKYQFISDSLLQPIDKKFSNIKLKRK